MVNRKIKQAYAFKKFRPKKADKGKIIFIGVRGGRLERGSAKRGFAVYVNTRGKKQIVRQLNRTTGRVEKTAIPRRINTIDVTRVRNKKAKKNYLTARLNPVARGALRRSKKELTGKGTRYHGKIKTNKFYEKSDAVVKIAKELVKAVRNTRSKKDFLVSIGLVVSDKEGKNHWIQLERRFSRADSQSVSHAEAQAFLGREVYAFLARELTMRGLVLAGSAAHVGRLKDNRGVERDEWQKDGFLWEGHDSENVKIQRVEWRFDQITFTK